MSMKPFENEIDQILTQAEALLQDEKPTEALALLERGRKLEPRHGWLTLFRGVAFAQLGRTEEATDQLITAADNNRKDIDIQVDAARHLSLLEQHQDALVCAARAIELEESDAGAQAILGEVLERLGRIEDAVQYRETAIMLEPDDMDSRYYLAVNYCDLGRHDEAYDISRPLYDEFPDDPDIIRLHGACLSYLGRHREALACWAELERIEGLTPNLLHNRASTLDVLGFSDEALSTINEAIEIDPDLALNYYTRGMIYEHKGEDALAIDDYLDVLAREPDNLDAVVNLVELSVAVGIVPAVLERLERLSEFSPDSAKLLYARGRLLMENGDFSQGIQILETAVRHEPSFSIAWYTLTTLYGMTDNFAASVAAADHALRFFPDDAGLWFQKGLAHHDLQQFPEALESYDRACALTPEDPVTLLQMGRLLLLDLDRPNDARGMLKEVLRLQPDNSSASWMLGLCYLRLGRLEEASKQLETLLRQDAENLWGRLVRAAYHTKTGNFSAAFDDLRVAAVEGYEPSLLLKEPLFEPLWSDDRFDEILRGSSKK